MTTIPEPYVTDMIEVCCDCSGEPEMFGLVPDGDEGMTARIIAMHVADFGNTCNISFRPAKGLQRVTIYPSITIKEDKS